MKYYSEKLKKLYDTEKELNLAEKKHDLEMTQSAIEELKRKREERIKEEAKEKRKEEVTKAYDDAYEAFKKAQELAEKYVDEYGEYKYQKDVEESSTLFPSWLWRWLDI